MHDVDHCRTPNTTNLQAGSAFGCRQHRHWMRFSPSPSACHLISLFNEVRKQVNWIFQIQTCNAVVTNVAFGLQGSQRFEFILKFCFDYKDVYWNPWCYQSTADLQHPNAPILNEQWRTFREQFVKTRFCRWIVCWGLSYYNRPIPLAHHNMRQHSVLHEAEIESLPWVSLHPSATLVFVSVKRDL